MDWEKTLYKVLGMIETGARRLGRIATRQVLRMYYVLREGDLSYSDKLKVYASLLYILIPNDLISHRIFGFLGFADDTAAVLYVIKKIAGKVTPKIDQKVEMTLDRWFGYEIISKEGVL